VRRALIGGIGNVLLGDDGVGPYVVKLLESRHTFDENVEIVDLGTPALDLTHRIVGLDTLMLVDCVASDEEEPGTVVAYRKEEIMRQAPRFDAHSPALSECLMAAEMLGQCPENVLLVGIVGKSYGAGEGISAAVCGSALRAIEIVIGELERCGFVGKQRVSPYEPVVWWNADRNSLTAEDAEIAEKIQE